MKGLSKPIAILFAAAVLFAVTARGQGSDSAANYSTNAPPPTAGTWTNSSNGGIGFDPWALFPGSSTAAQIYFLISSTTNGPGVHAGIDSPNGLAWGMYSTSGNCEGYRHFWSQAPLQVGQSVQLDFENGYVNGVVGYILQDNNADDRIEVYFPQGGANYILNIGNNDTNVAVNTGIPYNNTGLHGKFTLTGPDTMNVALTCLNGVTNSFTTNNVSLKGVLGNGITQLRMYNFQSAFGAAGYQYICFFNNLAESSRSDNCGAFDTASNYTSLDWTNTNAGNGFNIWSFQPQNTNNVASVAYALGDSTQPVLYDGAPRGINSQTSGQAFGMTASAAVLTNSGAVIVTNAPSAWIYRQFTQGGMTNGQSFAIDFQNSYINGGSSTNFISGSVTNTYGIPGGTVGFKLYDASAQTRMEVFFTGGASSYQMNIGSYNNQANLAYPACTNYTINIPVSFTDKGLRCTFTYFQTNSAPTAQDYMNVSIAGLNGFTGFSSTNIYDNFVTNGLPLIGTNGDAVTQVFLYDYCGGLGATNTVWFNNLALSGSCSAQVVPAQITSIKVVNPNVLVTIPTVAGQSYQLQTSPTLSSGGLILTNSNWSNVIGSGGAAVGTGSSVTLTNLGGAVGATQGFYRVIIN